MLYTDLRLNIMILIWISLMLFKKSDSAQTILVNQPDPMITAVAGDNVTLRCIRLGEINTDSIIWYKQKVGHEPHLMATVLTAPTYEDEFKSPRFSIKEEKKSCNLKIANVEASDEAMYYCGTVKFAKVFGKGTFLSVKGDGDLNVSVIQSGVLDSVPAGASVTLQCSVLSERREGELQLLWFRAAPPQSHPQIIYTHHNSSHQCESGSSTHTCVYNFSKNISRNDSGTYYCAVAVCGGIIFGNPTKIQKEKSVDPVVICLTAALGVCAVVIFTLIFIITCKRRNGEHHRVRLKQHSVAEKTLNKDCGNVELNYAALHFNERRAIRGREKKQPQDIIYSDVRCPSIT